MPPSDRAGPPPAPRRRLAALARPSVGRARVGMALRAAVAATLALLIAVRVPGASEFAFYAPFGAVVATHPAVVRSTTQTLRALAAILLGAGVGIVADLLLGRWTLLAVAAAVAVGVLLAGLPLLEGNRSYVPVAAVFLLLVGRGQEIGYAASYAGLFLLGALVTILLNAALPTLPFPEARRAVALLRREVAAHVRAETAVIDPDDDGGSGRPGPSREHLTASLSRTRSAVDDVVDAARGTGRTRRQLTEVDPLRADFRALERTVMLVDDLHALSEDAPWGARISTLAPALRRPVAAALRALADAVADVDLQDTTPGLRDDVDAAVRELAAALQEHRGTVGHDADELVVATILTTVRRTLSALTPSDRIQLSPTPWAEPETEPDDDVR